MIEEPQIDPQGRCDQCGRFVLTRKYADSVKKIAAGRLLARFWCWVMGALLFAMAAARMLT